MQWLLNEVTPWLLGCACGWGFGWVFGKAHYQKLLVLIAKCGTAEKLSDGNFYNIVPEKNEVKK